MNIQELHIQYENLLQANEIFMFEDRSNHYIFIKFRVLRNGVLKESEEKYLITLLKNEKDKWFVAHLIRVIDSFSEKLMINLLETAIQTEDPSYTGNFVVPAIRVFDLKVTNYFIARYQKATTEEKFRILSALYWCRDKCRKIFSKNGNLKEEYGAKFYWNGEKFIDYSDTNKTKMPQEEYDKYRSFAQTKSEEKYTFLIEEFLKETNTELKNHIAQYLPKNIEDYPLSLREKVKILLNK